MTKMEMKWKNNIELEREDRETGENKDKKEKKRDGSWISPVRAHAKRIILMIIENIYNILKQ